MRTGSSAAGFWLAFVLLSVLAALPIWTTEFLPLVDLPQHEAQVSILRHWDDAECRYPEIYSVNRYTPYWLGYGLAWALSWLCSVATSFRILITAVLVAVPLATRGLVRQLGGSEWWALLCFPLGYGSPMSWGFYNFLVAVPLVLLALRSAIGYARWPGLGRGLWLGVQCTVLFVAHALALVFAVLLVLALLAAEGPSVRAVARRAWPLLLALPLPVAWLVRTVTAETSEHSAFLYLFGIDRITGLPELLTGIPRGWLATTAAAAVLVSLALARPARARGRTRWAPFAVTAAIVVLAPNMFLGAAYLAPRFTIFLLPTLLCALDERSEPRPAGWRRRQPALVAAALLAIVVARFAGMEREGEGLGEVLSRAPAGQRLLYLDYDFRSRHSPEPAFLHFGSWYQVDRCGVAEMSFARNYPSPVRYRPGQATPLPILVEYLPYRFHWSEHGGESFDLFLVRAAGEVPEQRLVGGTGRLALLAQSGRWWLYRNLARGKPAGEESGGAGPHLATMSP